MTELSRRGLLLGAGLSLALFEARAAPESAARLEARPQRLRLGPAPGPEIEAFAFNGATPAPLLRARAGAPMRLAFANALAQPASFGFLGLALPNPQDGVAPLTQKPIAPGDAFDLSFTPRRAGLFAYRPLFAPTAAEQLGRGLYGAFIVDEDAPPQADRELVAVVADWRLAAGGGLDPDFSPGPEAAAGAGERLVTVEGAPAPLEFSARPNARVRLRLVSMAAARVFVAAFEGTKPMVVAVDGVPANAAFEPARRSIPVGPGARFDIFFDMPGAGETARVLMKTEDGAQAPLVSLRAEGEPLPARPPVPSLPLDPLLPARIKLEAAKRADFVIEPAATPGRAPDGTPLLWRVNGALDAPFAAKPVLTLKSGAPATLALVNRSPLAQQIHLRGHHMRLLHDLDDGWEPYWRDCVLVPPGRTKRVAFAAGAPGRWALLSLTPARCAAGLAGHIVVT
ncbi:multicopper oxidase family protein [Methylocella sp.]|uniref:multicopper oxidase family protein n=1 Tax=Methylocella sp. TaxID=1978226 RepID=UPI0037843D0F